MKHLKEIFYQFPILAQMGLAWLGIGLVYYLFKKIAQVVLKEKKVN